MQFDSKQDGEWRKWFTKNKFKKIILNLVLFENRLENQISLISDNFHIYKLSTIFSHFRESSLSLLFFNCNPTTSLTKSESLPKNLLHSPNRFSARNWNMDEGPLLTCKCDDPTRPAAISISSGGDIFCTLRFQEEHSRVKWVIVWMTTERNVIVMPWLF